jgi:hypothetical protein
MVLPENCPVKTILIKDLCNAIDLKHILKGYDRLTNGLSLNQFIGYYHLSNNRLINFYIGAQGTEGITQSRREWNLDTQTHDTAKRLDMLFGLRAGWILNLYQRAPNDYYIY